MATELGAIHLPNHELPTCRQSDGKFKKSYRSLEAAETFAKSIHDRYGDELQRAYECTITPGHFHLTTADYVPLEDRTSAPFARPRPLIPVASEEGEGRIRSARSVVEERREQVRAFVHANPESTYAEGAGALGLEPHIFNSDINILIEKGVLPRRAAGRPSTKTPVSATAKLAVVEAAIQQMLAAKAEIEAQVAREEADRIEREKVHISLVNVNSGEELSVRKGNRLWVAPLDVWREIAAAVSAEIQDK